MLYKSVIQARGHQHIPGLGTLTFRNPSVSHTEFSDVHGILDKLVKKEPLSRAERRRFKRLIRITPDDPAIIEETMV